MPALAGAALTVIYDSGDAAIPFLMCSNPRNHRTPASGTQPAAGCRRSASLLPIRSPGLTPGPVSRENHDRPLRVRSSDWFRTTCPAVAAGTRGIGSRDRCRRHAGSRLKHNGRSAGHRRTGSQVIRHAGIGERYRKSHGCLALSRIDYPHGIER